MTVRDILVGIVTVFLLTVSESSGEEGHPRTMDADGRGVMPEHGSTAIDPTLAVPRPVVPSAPASDLGRVPEPISPAPMLPFGPHTAPLVTPGSPKAPAVSPPSSGGFSTGTGR